MIRVETISGGLLPTNCYLFVDESTGKAAVVDPGFFSAELEQAVEQVGAENVEAILLTHGHYDHIMGVPMIKEMTGAKIYIHQQDAAFTSDSDLNLSRMIAARQCVPFTADVILQDGDMLTVGDVPVKLLNTPGHTRGSSCYLAEDALFTGDTLMRGTMGRTDFQTGNPMEMQKSLARLRDLPGDYRVYPGHGGESTMEYERVYNPFLRNATNDFDA
jgi:hydroxyacylglutathione hydrolase